MTAPVNRAAARVVAAHARDVAEARGLLDMLGLLDGPGGDELAPAREVPGGHRPAPVDVVLAERPPRPSTAPAALLAPPPPAPVPAPESPRKKVTVPTPARISAAERASERPVRSRGPRAAAAATHPQPDRRNESQLDSSPVLPPADAATPPAGEVGSPTWMLSTVREHDNQDVRRAAGAALIAWLQLRLAYEDLADVTTGAAS